VKVQTVAFKSTLDAGGTNSCFLKVSLCWRYKPSCFQINPYAGGANSCFLNGSLHWRYKQLLSKGIPTLEEQTVAS